MTRISLAEEYDNRDMVSQMVNLKKRQTDLETASVQLASDVDTTLQAANSAVTTAQGYATAAGNSATAAGNSATTATNKATEASGYASTATQKAQAAADSATAAAGSATQAASTLANCVTLTTAQTITGAKTFSGDTFVENTNPFFVVKDPVEVRGTHAASDKYAGLAYSDKNGVRLGAHVFKRETNGDALTYMSVMQDTVADAEANLGIRYNANGDNYGICPSYPSGAPSEAIATQGNLDNYIPMMRTTGNQTYAGTKTTSEMQIAPVRPYLFQRVDAVAKWYPVFSCLSGARKIIVFNLYGSNQTFATEDYAKLVAMTGRGVIKLVDDVAGSLDAGNFAWCYNSSTSRYELWVKGRSDMYTYVELVRAIRGNIEEPLSEFAKIFDDSQAVAELDTSILTSIIYGTS